MKPETEPSPNQVATPDTAPGKFESWPEEMGSPTSAGPTVSDLAIEAFRGTRGWVLLIGWTFVPIGLIIGLSALGELSELFAPDPFDAGKAFGRFAVAMLFAVAVFRSGVLLIRYGTEILRLILSRRLTALDRAAEAQLAFWRFLGGSIAVSLLVIFLLLLADSFKFAVVGGAM